MAQSLRSEGSMVLKSMGYNDSTIRKLGRWKSDTWQMHIHSQISKLYRGEAKNMSTPVIYHNIDIIEPEITSLAIA